MRTVKPIAFTAALCLFASGGALQLRADSANSSSQDSSQSDFGFNQSDLSQGQQTLRGTIDTVSQANWVLPNNQRDQRFVVRMQMEDGRIAYVDVGSKSKLKELNLTSGDQVQLKGHYINVDGRRILIADRVGVDGQMFTIQHNQESQGGQFSQAESSSGAQTIHGTIQGFKHVYLRDSNGSREQHSLAKMQLQNGRTIVADLGPKRDLDELGLEKGEPITLRGHRGTIDGETAFLADRIHVGDQTIRVARSNNGQQNNLSFSQNNSSESGAPFTLRGKVAGYQVITMESGQKEVSLLNLTLNDGRTVLIDAGNKRGELDLKDLDLHDQAIIKGHTKNVEGRQVLVADSVRFVNPQESEQGSMGQPGQEQKSSGSGSSRNQEFFQNDQQQQ